MNIYPLNTFFKEIFLVFATAIGSLKVANAFTVAFTTLCGFADPSDFASTSVIPAAFQNSTHTTSGNYTSTMCSRLYQNFCSAFFAPLLMWNSAMHYRNFYQILFSIINTF